MKLTEEDNGAVKFSDTFLIVFISHLNNWALAF
jgi:hypothetical protein